MGRGLHRLAGHCRAQRRRIRCLRIYTDQGGKITFSDTGTPVTRQESWVATVAKLSRKNYFLPSRHALRNHRRATCLSPSKNGLDRQDISGAVTANVATALADAIKPITEKVDAMEANIKATNDAVTANARKDEAEKREAVKAEAGRSRRQRAAGRCPGCRWRAAGASCARRATVIYSSERRCAPRDLIAILQARNELPPREELDGKSITETRKTGLAIKPGVFAIISGGEFIKALLSGARAVFHTS